MLRSGRGSLGFGCSTDFLHRTALSRVPWASFLCFGCIAPRKSDAANRGKKREASCNGCGGKKMEEEDEGRAAERSKEEGEERRRWGEQRLERVISYNPDESLQFQLDLLSEAFY
jgi:hypothetical protein